MIRFACTTPYDKTPFDFNRIIACAALFPSPPPHSTAGQCFGGGSEHTTHNTRYFIIRITLESRPLYHDEGLEDNNNNNFLSLYVS